ncbi:MinD/ParA family protein [Oceanobacillus sp. J11TS1]|uniref:MinD/ParA family protein n=1 Tax=Oceanobacillus sp. J11TS1 TaxID=2807191 RepID=UPI001B13B884|nr:MinD/ParA family protein [Oceanobacillus sp. J11TS1]GIO21986.1 flagellum site-determining protein YlxH [Oceanobacillus sp. J11TS1]
MSYDQAEKLRSQLASHRTAKTIAICSGKGGVGKSNFTLNFAIKLASQNNRILIFDLDVGMGNIDLLLGMQTKHSIADALNNRISIEEAIVKSNYGVDYIPGGSGLRDILEIDQHNKKIFSQGLASVLREYDFVLFDMGAGVTETALFFILAADECFVITTPEPTSITDAYGMVKHILVNQVNMPIYTILNRSRNNSDGKTVLNNFHKVIHRFLDGGAQALGLIPEDANVVKAVMHQEPYTILYPKTKASKAMELILQSYVQQTSNRSRKSGSFLERIKYFIVENRP